MKEIKKSIVNETVGTLAAELEAQELGDVNGGATPVTVTPATPYTPASPVISAATAVTALSANITGRVSDKRNCGAYWTVSYECMYWAC